MYTENAISNRFNIRFIFIYLVSIILIRRLPYAAFALFPVLTLRFSCAGNPLEGFWAFSFAK